MNREWEWRFLLSWLMRAIRGMTQEEKGNFLDDTIIALQAREKGANAFADALIARADELSEKQRKNRVGSGGDGYTPERPTMVNHGEPRSAMANHGRTYENEDENEEGEKQDKNETETEDESESPPAPPPPATHDRGQEQAGQGEAVMGAGGTTSTFRNSDSVSVSGFTTKSKKLGVPANPIDEAMKNPKEAVSTLDRVLLPEFAAAYCNERNNMRSVGIYGTCCKIHGEQFRDELRVFIFDCETGDEPDNRGRAFMARLRNRFPDCFHNSRRRYDDVNIKGVRIASWGDGEIVRRKLGF